MKIGNLYIEHHPVWRKPNAWVEVQPGVRVRIVDIGKAYHTLPKKVSTMPAGKIMGLYGPEYGLAWKYGEVTSDGTVIVFETGGSMPIKDLKLASIEAYLMGKMSQADYKKVKSQTFQGGK